MVQVNDGLRPAQSSPGKRTGINPPALWERQRLVTSSMMTRR